MDYVHRRVASAIITLADIMEPGQYVMPVALDGAVAYHLSRFRWMRKGLNPEDQLGNTIQATSRLGEMDEAKFRRILQDAYSADKSVYALDIRTKTGRLGSMLRGIAGSTSTRFLYAVLFDPNHVADIMASDEDLTDEERSHIYWTPTREAQQEFIRKEGNLWVYNLSHDALSRLDHVQPIKDLLMQLG
ncbi:MAG: hypothetical protein HYW26_00815 [Candidatus Aenigmarchaeota archaeon]|nr:hypothetical protein [Candidatus Aenigmarchaeota archaeon]